MSPIVVFLCNNELELKKINEQTFGEPYHRMFVLSNKFLKEYLELKKTDSLLVLDYENLDMNAICRFISLYSNPQYSHILLCYNFERDIYGALKKFENNENFQIDDFVGFTRYFLSINGFNFEDIKKINVNQIDLFDNIQKALNGDAVDNFYFIEALKEILPECTYINLDSLPKNETEIYKVFNSKNKSGKTIYTIYQENTSDDIKNKIIFTSSEVKNYKYKIKRTDGLICYII